MNSVVQQNLLIFGSFICLLIPIMVFASFLSGHGHLLTSRNMIIGGCFPFVGLSSIGLSNWERPYTTYDPADFEQFAFMFILFLLVFSVAYKNFNPSPTMLHYFAGEKILISKKLTVVLALFAVILSLLDFGMKRISYFPFLTELLTGLAPSFMAFAGVFAIAVWTKNKTNPFAFLTLAGILLFSLVYSVVGSGGGRRILLSVLLAVPIYLYWTGRISNNPGDRLKSLLRVGVVIVPLTFVMLAYSNLRHFDRGYKYEETSVVVRRSIDSFTAVPSEIYAILTGDRMEEIFVQIGQDATNCSMLMVNLVRLDDTTGYSPSFQIPQPFNTIVFVLTNPIPRSRWEGKPLSLGYMLPIEVLRVGGVSMGPGIVGHCVHEGGVFFIVLYGVMFAYFSKLFDMALTRDPSNLFLLGLATATFPNILMLVRGDQGIVILTCLFSYLSFVIAWRIGRRLSRYLMVGGA